MKENTPKHGSSFSGVYYWNALAGVEKGDCVAFDSKIARDLIVEEYNEYIQALGDKNKPEIAKELTDLLFVVIGAFYRYGLDADVCLNHVLASNFSKFCTTEAEAKASVKALAKNDKKSSYKKVGKYYILFDVDTGKILKGNGYFSADFSTLGEV